MGGAIVLLTRGMGERLTYGIPARYPVVFLKKNLTHESFAFTQLRYILDFHGIVDYFILSSQRFDDTHVIYFRQDPRSLIVYRTT